MPTDDTRPCEFGPPHEPFGCKVHYGIRRRLDETTCNRVRRRDDEAIVRLVDAAIRRGEISESRGAEILGLGIREWRSRAASNGTRRCPHPDSALTSTIDGEWIACTACRSLVASNRFEGADQ